MLGDSFSSSWRGENEVIKGGDQTHGFGGVGEALTRGNILSRRLQSLPRPAAPQILSIAVDAASCKWRKKIA